MKGFRTALLAGSALVATMMAPAAMAEWVPDPNRSITMIVPVPPGGGTDGVARLVAPLMAEDLGIRIDIVNRPGASMQIGTNELVNAAPDGYTVMVAVLPTAMAWLDEDRGATYGRDDLQPIGSAVEESPAITVLADSPFETLADLVEAARADPEGLTVGTPGLMATGHLASVGFMSSLDIEMTSVNFTGGAALLTALLGGHVDVSFNSITEVVEQAAAGNVRILGVVSDDDDHPSGVPTVRSQGFDMPTLSINIGMMGPTGMPDEVVARLSDSLRMALENDEVAETLRGQSRSILFLDAEDYAAHWDTIEAAFGPLIDIAKQQGE